MKKNSYNSKRSFFKISILSFFTTLLWKKITFSDYKVTEFEKKTVKTLENTWLEIGLYRL